MIKKILCLVMILLVSGCSYLRIQTKEEATQMPYSRHQSYFRQKDYDVMGRVRGEYTKVCLLFGILCNQDIDIYDDLLKKGVELGANEVINVVIDENMSSLVTYPLFSRHRFVANGLAIKIKPIENTQKNRKKTEED
ncbi:MAG: hypothetical protein J6U64_01550 [Alphaproteobacteria bacterium]|nr:hypothetical protein [Alphaproteobacteria bacterium]